MRSLALIPEAISFSIIAGVDPRIGLFASFTMAVSIAFLGGRPAMISAATGAIALVIAPVMRDHGCDHLIATVLLGGAIQIALGLAGVARLMRFIPRQVMVGFVSGCAMIGQTMINVKASGARTHLSTFLAGVFLLVLVVGFGDVVALIPMAALVALMIIVSVGTFDWHSVQPRTLRRMPKSETLVMLSTVVVTVATHNLAIGVGVGVLVAMTLFARRVAHLTETHREIVEDERGTAAVYRVTGELFFASSNDLYTQFDYADDPDRVVIDLTDSHIWDASTVAALDAITTKYAPRARLSRSPASTMPVPSATTA